MRATRLYSAKLFPVSWVVMCDDGEFRLVDAGLRIRTNTLRPDYIPRRIGRGVDDCTDTPDGKIVLNTINAMQGSLEQHRAAGSVKSEAKAEAARRNGAKGGRPRTRTWFVANDAGDLACHDCDRGTAEECLKARQEEEPEAGWEMFDASED